MWVKIAVFIWPFLKEMILGERTLKEAVKSNKIRVLTIGVIFLSLALNFFALPRLVSITKQHLELMKKYKYLQANYDELKAKKVPPVFVVRPLEPPAIPNKEPPASKHNAIKPGKPGVPLTNPAANHSKPDETEEERLRKLQQQFEKIQQQENSQRMSDALRKNKESGP